jgi:tetratricopeptide (TPR) repeat protein
MMGGARVADRFDIIRQAGEGGMSTVFHARDTHTGADVALKVLRIREHANRFAREAQVLAELNDPTIVRYVSHGAVDDCIYLAMEWLEGEDLAARLVRGRLPLAEALVVAERVARALAIAHARGIIHRDVKPSNVFLPGHRIDDAKVLDFGIALWSTQARTRTRPGTVFGTPGYVAPEYARGQSEIDGRVDVFALGCVLFECVTGKATFAGAQPVAVLAKILFEDAPRARSLDPQLPRELDALVARMLARDPAERPADGTAVLGELAALHQQWSGPTAPESVPRLGRVEQRFVAVVLTRTDSSREPLGSTVTTADGVWLAQVAGEHHGRADWLIDGTMVVVVEAAGGNAADHAAQAALCALEIRSRYPTAPMALAIGRVSGSSARAIGEVIDRAVSHLRTESQSSAIRLDDVAAGLLETRFATRRVGETIELEGEHDIVGVARTLLGKPTPCVGRDRELAVLEGYYDECVSETRARAVLVTAPAGTGKSRLAYELVRRIGARAEIWIARGDPMRTGSPFGLLAPLIRRTAGILEGEPLAVTQAKLHTRLARTLDADSLPRITTFLCELVGASDTERLDPQLVLARRNPKLLGEHMRQAWCDWLSAECAAKPVAILLEDLHWGDWPTVKFIEAAMLELEHKPLFVLALARPEIDELFPRLWAQAGAQEMRLGVLSKKACEQLVRRMLGAHADAAAVEALVRQAAGNAFFLEELIRSAAEGNTTALPETVLAVATARLERLSAEARHVLRAASVFGEVFWRGGVLSLVGDATAIQVDALLATLTTQEVVTVRADARFAGETEFAFRHALVREAAYAMLTDADRALGHKLAGGWLEFAGEAQAATLADHFERGGEGARASHWCGRAAAQALEANDFRAALGFAQRALDLGAAGDAVVDLQVIRGKACGGLGMWTDGQAAFSRALDAMSVGERRLAPQRLRNPHERRADILLRMANLSYFAFDLEKMMSHASKVRELLGDGDELPELVAEAIACQAIFAQAAGDLRGAIRLYDEAKARSKGGYFAGEAQLVLSYQWLGDCAAVIARGTPFVDVARRMKDVAALMQSLPHNGLALAGIGRYREAAQIFAEAREIGRRHDTKPLLARALAMSTGFHFDLHDFAGGALLAEEAQEIARSVAFTPTMVSAGIDLLLSHLHRRDVVAADKMLGGLSALVAETGHLGWHGWLFRIRFDHALAEFSLARGDAAEALVRADSVLAQSRDLRPKYEVLARGARARALHLLGRTHDAAAEARTALSRARAMGSPSVVLRTATTLLAIEGDDTTREEVRAVIKHMADCAPEDLRSGFLSSDTLRQLV